MVNYSKRALIYIPSAEKDAPPIDDNQKLLKDNTTASVDLQNGTAAGVLANWQMTPEDFLRMEIECAKIPGAVFIEMESWDPDQCSEAFDKLLIEGINIKPSNKEAVAKS